MWALRDSRGCAYEIRAHKKAPPVMAELLEFHIHLVFLIGIFARIVPPTARTKGMTTKAISSMNVTPLDAMLTHCIEADTSKRKGNWNPEYAGGKNQCVHYFSPFSKAPATQ